MGTMKPSFVCFVFERSLNFGNYSEANLEISYTKFERIVRERTIGNKCFIIFLPRF